ncbi:mannosyltransferase [Ichthyenterobacterium magnum]|uniref:Mannosyltransferase n=1 Tax=Ichthyenterobacterium magnum TaxID=1230530 RepID=A0A420DW39_9FLAO|nr:mannosyltransferase [Ichthyenterobacterium magnum]RKE98421.1 hypothetical protein BXY80_0508 [Ichthyenterobacterium magnum]
MQLWKFHKTPILLTFVSAVLYFFFAYNLIRTEYSKLIFLYFGLCILFYFVMYSTKIPLRFLVVISILFRLVFLMATPNLSQDFYRFIWDGRMILEGINPYLFTPESFIASNQLPISQAQELYIGMGKLNASHFTNYPPINQLCFSIAALFSGKSILGSAMVMRLLIIMADIGTLYFGKKLLEKLNLPIKNIFWYILNPFIIIELTGNLHFEGVMIFFLVWSLYLLHSNKWKLAALIFACSISVKLIPLMFLPLFYQWFTSTQLCISIKKENLLDQGLTKLISFYGIVGISTLLLFLPFFNLDFISNYSKTVALWFNNFEFNASIYYVAREIGYWFRGYNEIAVIGKTLAIIVVLIILGLAFLKKIKTLPQLISAMLLAITAYLFFSTTVHPWYIATPLILSVFTSYKFPVVWSFVIILSYLAYINIDKADKSENLWVIGLEYLIIYSFFIWEVFFKKPKANLHLQ